MNSYFKINKIRKNRYVTDVVYAKTTQLFREYFKEKDLAFL